MYLQLHTSSLTSILKYGEWLNPKFDPATLGSYRYPPLAGRNTKQYQMTKIRITETISFENFEY